MRRNYWQKNEDLSDVVKCLKSEISTLSTTTVSVVSDVESVDDSTFCFQTKGGGRVYTTAVRELYYTLLAKQLPPAKIATIILFSRVSYPHWMLRVYNCLESHVCHI